MTKSMCELLETYSQVSFNLLDIRDQMSMSHALMKIDKANQFFGQQARLDNPKETHLDYDAIEQYYQSSEAVMDFEEKYFDCDDDEDEAGVGGEAEDQQMEASKK